MAVRPGQRRNRKRKIDVELWRRRALLNQVFVELKDEFAVIPVRPVGDVEPFAYLLQILDARFRRDRCEMSNARAR